MRGLKAWWARRVSRADDPDWLLYRDVAAKAVAPERIALFGLEDTPEMRFEILALHLAAAWARLDAGDAPLRRMRRGLGEAFVADMDASLRDLGAGDLGVGKRVKALAERLYGRVGAYGPAFAEDAERAVIADALERNLYKEGPPADAEAPARAADAVRQLGQAWRAAPSAAILAGKGPDL